VLQRLLIATTILTIFIITGSASIVAEGNSEEELQKIAAIKYRGLDFSSNVSDLLKARSNAKLNNNHPGSDKGVLTYEIRDDSDIDCVLLRFFDDALVEIKYFYFPPRVSVMGGPQPLTSLAVEEYGVPTKRIKQKLFWDYPSIDRMIEVNSENGQWTMRLLHRSRYLGVPDYKDTAINSNKSWMQVAIGPPVPSKPKSRPKTKSSVPDSVVEAIERKAKFDHPNDSHTQFHVVDDQNRAYLEWTEYECPREIPNRVYKFLRGKIARDHLTDYPTRIYVLRNQLSAYMELANMSKPTGMAGSHFFSLRTSAVRKHPRNYSTQLYMLKRYINDYLRYRETGYSGDGIVRYLLRHG